MPNNEITDATFVEDKTTDKLRQGEHDGRTGTVVLTLHPSGKHVMCKDVLRSEFYAWVNSDYDPEKCPANVRIP